MTDSSKGHSLRTLSELLDAAPDAMVVVNEEGSIVLVNSPAESLFGYRREELVGQSVEKLVPDRLQEIHSVERSVYAADPRLRPMGARMDLRGRRKDGSEFRAEISLSPMQTDEGMLVWSAIRDIGNREV